MLVDSGDLVGVFEIAAVCRVTRACVSGWRRNFVDFPQPVAELRCGPVFARSHVDAWLRKVYATKRFGNSNQRDRAGKWRSGD